MSKRRAGLQAVLGPDLQAGEDVVDVDANRRRARGAFSAPESSAATISQSAVSSGSSDLNFESTAFGWAFGCSCRRPCPTSTSTTGPSMAGVVCALGEEVAGTAEGRLNNLSQPPARFGVMSRLWPMRCTMTSVVSSNSGGQAHRLAAAVREHLGGKLMHRVILSESLQRVNTTSLCIEPGPWRGALECRSVAISRALEVRLGG